MTAEPPQPAKTGKMPPHTKILIGLIAGASAGVITNLITDGGAATQEFVRLITEPVGKMWLAGLIMVVIPLIFSTLALGIGGLGDIRRLGRIGLAAILGFLGLTTLSTTLGLFMVNTINPGAGLSPEVTTKLMETYRGQVEGAMGLSQDAFNIDLLVRIIPRNPVAAMANGDMLSVIFFTLMVGIALTLISREKAMPMIQFLESVAKITFAIIEIIMKLAPIGVFCLIFSVTARFGFDLLFNLIKYIGTVVGSLLIFQVVGYPLILKFIARRNPWEFFKKARIVMLTAFSTSSSNATLPTTLRVSQNELGIPREIAGFVLPLGATMNMNGTALFEGATVLFIAQVFGVELSLGAQLIVVLMSVVTAIGVAGVPGGSIPLLMMVLTMVGVPMEGIAIVLGVDRILDMCRTVLNVSGDMVTATIVNRFVGAKTPATVTV
jgi:DAACS family dicarboxylate/amino acid:cation (Na+ or H+) symporter